SEVSRTMRQNGLPIEEIGTDHNPLNNTVLIGGKGVRGGYVVGESDFRTADEELSGAHIAFDPRHVKVMGKPFDFKSGRPRSDKPASYDEADFLTINNVANTVYKLFGVGQEQWRVLGRTERKAQPLDLILV